MPTTTGLATSFITFSRPGASGGGATVTDRDGKIKWAGHNLLTNSESFDASAWNQFLTTVTANSTVAPNGTTTADTITNSGNTAGIYQFANVSPGASYTFAFWAKRGTSTSANYSIFDATNAADIVATTSYYSSIDTTGWSLITLNFTAPAGCTSVRCYPLRAPATTGTIFIWGAHLYRSDLGGMQLNPAQPAGMQSYYPTTPRNLLGYTEAVGSWGLLAEVQTSANVTMAPNGLQTADKIAVNNGTTANNTYAGQAVTQIVGTPYTYSIYVKKAETRYVTAAFWYSPTNYAGMQFDFDTQTVTRSAAAGTTYAVTTADFTSIGNGWYRLRLLGTVGQTNGAIAVIGTNTAWASGAPIVIQTGNGSDGIYLWGAQLADSASLDTYVPVYGAAVTSAAYYAPRLDFDGATLSPKGFLVEEQRSNLAVNSNTFSGWSAEAIISSTSSVTPAGTANSYKIVEANATVFQSIFVQPPIPSAGTYTRSVYAKAAERSWIKILQFDGVTNWGAYFNLADGTIGTVESGITASIQNAGNGWYRCSVTATTNGSATSERMQIALALSNGGSPIYAGNGTSGILIWGGQLEAGSFSTSLIVTGSTSATRAADVASVSTQAFPYSASEGTVVVSLANVQSTGAAPTFVSFDDGNGGYDNAREIYLQGANGDIIAYEASSNVTAVNSVVIYNGPVGTAFTGKVAYAYKASDFDASYNGNAAASLSTSGTPAANISRMGIGTNFPASASGATGGQAHIRQITYIPRKLTDAELATRSA